MNRFGKKRFHLIGALATIAVMWTSVIWMIERRASILRDGREIVLKTRPVDPRSLLRGRYVWLNFDISQISLRVFEEMLPGENLSDYKGRTVYVTLEADDEGRHVFKKLSFEKPGDGLFIKGVASGTNRLEVEYGIERFYASETLAPDLGKNMRGGAITDIVVSVADDGTAQIKALRQGERIFFTELLY